MKVCFEVDEDAFDVLHGPLKRKWWHLVNLIMIYRFRIFPLGSYISVVSKCSEFDHDAKSS